MLKKLLYFISSLLAYHNFCRNITKKLNKIVGGDESWKQTRQNNIDFGGIHNIEIVLKSSPGHNKYVMESAIIFAISPLLAESASDWTVRPSNSTLHWRLLNPQTG